MTTTTTTTNRSTSSDPIRSRLTEFEELLHNSPFVSRQFIDGTISSEQLWQLSQQSKRVRRTLRARANAGDDVARMIMRGFTAMRTSQTHESLNTAYRQVQSGLARMSPDELIEPMRVLTHELALAKKRLSPTPE